MNKVMKTKLSKMLDFICGIFSIAFVSMLLAMFFYVFGGMLIAVITFAVCFSVGIYYIIKYFNSLK